MRDAEINANVSPAKLMKLGGVKRFTYLSARGVSQNPSWLQSFVKKSVIKGEAEKLLTEIGFDHCSMAHPGLIFDRPDDSLSAFRSEYFMNQYTRFLLNTSYGIRAIDIAKAIVANSLSESPIQILENEEMKKIANLLSSHQEKEIKKVENS